MMISETAELNAKSISLQMVISETAECEEHLAMMISETAELNAKSISL